jgi:hypothetical protein
MQDELTIKEFVLTLQEYLKHFLRKWYWFLLGAVIAGGVFFLNAYMAPVTFTAPLTFLMKNDKEKSFGAGALLGSLGLGSPDPGKGNASKLLELGKSRRVLGLILFDSAAVDGKSKLVADHLIDAYEYHEKWEESEKLAGFYFNGKLPSEDDGVGNQALKILHERMIREDDGILTIDLAESSGLFSIKASTPAPELSIAITKMVYKELSDYFINASVSDQQASLQLLTTRADSVEIELALAESRLARFQDLSTRMPLRQQTVRGQKLQRDVLILSTMYAEILKNRETASFLLSNEKPGFELVDGPLVPLYPNKEPFALSLLMGTALGLIVAGMVLFGVKFIQDALRS